MRLPGAGCTSTVRSDQRVIPPTDTGHPPLKCGSKFRQTVFTFVERSANHQHFIGMAGVKKDQERLRKQKFENARMDTDKKGRLLQCMKIPFSAQWVRNVFIPVVSGGDGSDDVLPDGWVCGIITISLPKISPAELPRSHTHGHEISVSNQCSNGQRNVFQHAYPRG